MRDLRSLTRRSFLLELPSAAFLLGVALNVEGKQPAKTPAWSIIYLKDSFAVQGFIRRESRQKSKSIHLREYRSRYSQGFLPH